MDKQPLIWTLAICNQPKLVSTACDKAVEATVGPVLSSWYLQEFVSCLKSHFKGLCKNFEDYLVSFWVAWSLAVGEIKTLLVAEHLHVKIISLRCNASGGVALSQCLSVKVSYSGARRCRFCRRVICSLPSNQWKCGTLFELALTVAEGSGHTLSPPVFS